MASVNKNQLSMLHCIIHETLRLLIIWLQCILTRSARHESNSTLLSLTYKKKSRTFQTTCTFVTIAIRPKLHMSDAEDCQTRESGGTKSVANCVTSQFDSSACKLQPFVSLWWLLVQDENSVYKVWCPATWGQRSWPSPQLIASSLKSVKDNTGWGDCETWLMGHKHESVKGLYELVWYCHSVVCCRASCPSTEK